MKGLLKLFGEHVNSTTVTLGLLLVVLFIAAGWCARPAVLAFFFFQAEDGIRYHCVTGVQTCALPICRELDHRVGVPVAPRHHIESFGPDRTPHVTAKYLLSTLPHKLSSPSGISGNEAMLPQEDGEPVDEV